MNETFYMADDAHEDEIYGSDSKKCLRIKTVEKLASGWEMTTEELLDMMHEASEDEISEYGIYEG